MSLINKIPKDLRDNLENDKIVMLNTYKHLLGIYNIKNDVKEVIEIRPAIFNFEMIDEKRIVLANKSSFIIFDLELKKEILSIPKDIVKHKFLIIERSEDIKIIFYLLVSSYIYSVNEKRIIMNIDKPSNGVKIIKYLKYPNNDNLVLRVCPDRIETIELAKNRVKILKTMENISDCFLSKFHKNSIFIVSSGYIYLLNLSNLSLKTMFDGFKKKTGESVDYYYIVELSKSEIIWMYPNSARLLTKDWNKVTISEHRKYLGDLPALKKFAAIDQRLPGLTIYNYDDTKFKTIEGEWTKVIEIPKRYDKLTPYIKEYIQETNYIPKDIANIIGKLL